LTFRKEKDKCATGQVQWGLMFLSVDRQEESKRKKVVSQRFGGEALSRVLRKRDDGF